jgi:hypothetical protein
LITIDDELLITKEINAITVDYAKKVVLRKLLMTFCFDTKQNTEGITDLIQSFNFYGIDAKPMELEFKLSDLLGNFIKNLKKEERIALYFWILNQKYLYYLDELEDDDNECSQNEFNRKFGRALAYKIYEPNNSYLRQDTIQELKYLLCNFAAEFDFSLIDEYTPNQILEEIDNYCS